MDQSLPTWNEFVELNPTQKSQYLKDPTGKLKHICYSQQFDREFLDHICNLTNTLRTNIKTLHGLPRLSTLLFHKQAMLYFNQPSTRTFLSFQSACHKLGMKTSEIRDPNVSSEVKGESQSDSIRTFSSYFDVIITRHSCPNFADLCAWTMLNSGRPVPVINGGSGKDQHPTQALLDIYTLQRSFEEQGGIDNKTIMMVGDLKRGRTVRSLSELMRHYKDVTLIFASPEKFRMEDDVKRQLTAAGVQYIETEDMHTHLEVADAVYMTRIQDEHDKEAGSSERYYRQFCIGREEMDSLKPTAVVMHPFPRREEISTEVDSDPRSMYWRQMRNGMWVRSALLCYLFDVNVGMGNGC